MKAIDLINRKILVELDSNARQTNTQIAKKIGTSRDIVAYRIKQMEESGLIRNYTPMIDTSAIGYQMFKVYLKFFGMNKERFDTLIDVLKNEKRVWRLYGGDGNWDIFFDVFVRDIREFKEIKREMLEGFRQHISEKKVSIVTKYLHMHKAMILDIEKPLEFESTVGSDVQEFDNTDIMIIRSLLGNARKGYTQIGKEIGIDQATVKIKIKDLEKKNIIQAYRTRIDFTRFSYVKYSVSVDVLDTKKLQEIENYIRTIPEAASIVESINGADIEFDLYIKDDEEYFRIMEDLKERFDFIASINYFRMLKIYKNIYMPETLEEK